MANYNVEINNGSGSASVKKGTYSVSVVATGYDNSTLNPTTFTATDSAGSQTFTVSASGTLTFIVNETGAQGGTPITSGTIVMTDSTGNVQYGSPITVSSNGEAIFPNVPYGDGTSPYTLYFKQLTSDDNHNIYEGVLTVNLTAQTQTEYIQNNPIALQTFTLTDATYTGLPVKSATLTLTRQ